MKIDREGFLEYVRKADLAKVVALDISVFSKSLNNIVCGRIQQAIGGIISVHTGVRCQYTVSVASVGNQRTDVFFVKESKAGVEYISKHIGFFTKDSCISMVKALLDKIERDGGTLRKIFPNRKLIKFLGEETMKVEDKENGTALDYEGIYGSEMGWTGMQDNPYAGHQSFNREKKFYFKECGRKAITSK